MAIFDITIIPASFQSGHPCGFTRRGFISQKKVKPKTLAAVTKKLRCRFFNGTRSVDMAENRHETIPVRG